MIKSIFAVLALMFMLMQPVYSQTICQYSDSDSDGDGWGWENDASCKVGSTTGDATEDTTETPVITESVSACVADMRSFNDQIQGGFSDAGAVSAFLSRVLSAIFRHGSS